MILTLIAIAYALWVFIDSLDVDPHIDVDDTRVPGSFPLKFYEPAPPDSTPTHGLDDNQPGEPVFPGSAHTSAGIETNSSLHGGASANAYDHNMRQALSEVRDALFVPVSDCKRCSRYKKRLDKAKLLVASALIDCRNHEARVKRNFLDSLWHSARRALHDASCAFNTWEKKGQEHAWTHNNLIAQSTGSGEGSGAGAAPASGKGVAAILAPANNTSAAPAIGKGTAVKTPSASITNPAPASGKSTTVDEPSAKNTFADWLFDWLSNPSKSGTGRACRRKRRPSNRVAVPPKPSRSGAGRTRHRRQWRSGAFVPYQIPKRGRCRQQRTHSPIVYNNMYVSAPQRTQSTFGAGPSVPTPIPFASNGAVVGLNTAGRSATGGSIAQNDIGARIDIPAQHAGTSNGVVVGLNPAGQGSTGGSIVRTPAPLVTYTEYYARFKTRTPSAVKRPRQQPSYIARRFVKIAVARLRSPANDSTFTKKAIPIRARQSLKGRIRSSAMRHDLQRLGLGLNKINAVSTRQRVTNTASIARLGGGLSLRDNRLRRKRHAGSVIEMRARQRQRRHPAITNDSGVTGWLPVGWDFVGWRYAGQLPVGWSYFGQSATGGSTAQNDIGARVDIPAQHAGASNGAAIGLCPAGQGITGGGIAHAPAPQHAGPGIVHTNFLARPNDGGHNSDEEDNDDDHLGDQLNSRFWVMERRRLLGPPETEYASTVESMFRALVNETIMNAGDHDIVATLWTLVEISDADIVDLHRAAYDANEVAYIALPGELAANDGYDSLAPAYQNTPEGGYNPGAPAYQNAPEEEYDTLAPAYRNAPEEEYDPAAPAYGHVRDAGDDGDNSDVESIAETESTVLIHSDDEQEQGYQEDEPVIIAQGRVPPRRQW
ncbi:hypothetical protein GGH93_001183 [Coemansia aciculifera]|nr:hypothetical protein GGH93_001183 [Coemansia aciculifera]